METAESFIPQKHSNHEEPTCSSKGGDETNEIPTTLEDLVKVLLPKNFSTTPRMMTDMLNSFKDKSLIINSEEKIEPCVTMNSARGGFYHIPTAQCSGCRYIVSADIQTFLYSAHQNDDKFSKLPKIPCPSCQGPSKLLIVKRYLCASCEEQGVSSYVPKILCPYCRVELLTHRRGIDSFHFTPEDFMPFEIPFVNSVNPLFQFNKNVYKFLEIEHRMKLARYLKDKKAFEEEKAYVEAHCEKWKGRDGN